MKTLSRLSNPNAAYASNTFMLMSELLDVKIFVFLCEIALHLHSELLFYCDFSSFSICIFINTATEHSTFKGKSSIAETPFFVILALLEKK